MLAALACLYALTPSHTVVLYRGATLEGSETRYWSCEDTALDKEHSQRSYGQGLLLWAGTGKRILLRFGDLERAVGPGKKIVKARLVLPVESVTRAGSLKLSRFGARWYEGAGTGSPTQQPPECATTWAFQMFRAKEKPLQWKDGGAAFLSGGVTAEVAVGQREVVLDGLEKDVQNFYGKWYQNNGWAIDFSGEAALNSAQDGEEGPRLEIETEDAALNSGPDLSVTYISRSPEYDRYDNRGDAYVRMSVGGHESGVMMKLGLANTKKWPAEGEEVTYTACVKNVGTAPAQGCSYLWSSDFQPESGGMIEGPIAPGETKQVTLKSKFRTDHTDHRNQPISLTITPLGDDALATNDSVEINACALNLGIWVDEGFYKMFSEKPNGSGSRAFEDWIQWQFRIWNDVFLRQSRFGVAPDGCRESVRVGKITVVPNGTLKGGAHLPNDAPTLAYDGEWGFDSSFGEAARYADVVRTQADRALIHEMSHQIGLIDLYWMNVDPSAPDGTRGKVRLKHGGFTVTRGEFDPFGGLMGGGDTRNDSEIHQALPIPQEPLDLPMFTGSVFRSTDLYSLTDVVALNSNLGFRRGFFGEFMYSMPSTVLARVVGRDGAPITEGTLRFYQMKNGELSDLAPDFEIPFKNGVAQIPNRPTGLDAPFTTATGHILKPNPFGRTDVVGMNGVFLIQLDYQGQTEWNWLKAWQLVDSYYRGNKGVYVHELQFNVTQRPLKEQDWALKKTALDKANSSGSNLANLLDGNPKTLYEASGEAGDWFEIDIGRDRPIGEIRLLMSGDAKAFWSQFSILVYGTGQTVSSARIFAKELDWKHAATHRSDIDSKDFDVRSVAYCATPQTVRFIRIVNKSGGKGKLGGISIREVELGQ